MTTAFKTNQYQDFISLDQELSAFERMTEEEVIRIYNVDYKEEARVFITEHWDYVNSKDLREAYL